MGRLFDTQRQEGILMGLFSILSVLFSCFGIFGLVTYVVESKTKELGIRKIFGATVRNLTGMLTKEFFILVAISSVIAIPLAYWCIEQMLQDYSYRISIDWLIFATTLLITMILTLFTVGWKALRAATCNPVEVLKIE